MTRRTLVRETYRATTTNKSTIRMYAILAFVCLAISSVAWGQVLYGTLTGNVTDPSGAVTCTGRSPPSK